LTPRLDARTWASLFLLATATLAYEINLTRIYSVAQFYHLAFMIVSIALLGLGASGTAIAVIPALHRGNPDERLGPYACAASASILGSYLLINWLPFDSFSLAWDRRQFSILALHYVALAMPFFCSGLVLGAFLSQRAEQAGSIYAANMVGSAAGCLVGLVVPAYMGAEGAVSVYAGAAALAALVSTEPRAAARRPAAFASVLLIAFCLIDAGVRASGAPPFKVLSLRLSPYKGLSYALLAPGAKITYQEWNAFSRIDIVEGSAAHSVPGLSYRYLGSLPRMPGLYVDGDDLSPVARPSMDAAFVAYLPTAIAFALRPEGSVLILEPRGGLDVLTGLTLNSGPKTAVEINRLITAAIPLYSDQRLHVVSESGRSFLRRTTITYDVIVVSLASGYRPVRSGAYSLGEDYRYTVEGFTEALQHLAPGGLLISTRWLQDPPSEDLRLFTLAATALEKAGGEARSQLVAFRGFNAASVLLKNGEFSAVELTEIRRLLGERAFDLSYAPDVAVEETNQYNILQASIYHEAYRNFIELPSREEFYAAYNYDVRPPTDDRPFFGHYFKWRQAPQIIAEFGRAWQPFGGAGYLVVLALLLLAILLASALIFLPVLLRGFARPEKRISFALRDLLYFGLLGFGFLLVEIPLLQTFILYLDQPAYATGIVLFALLFFSGIGSQMSPRIRLRPALVALVVIVLMAPALLRHAVSQTIGFPLAARMALTTLMLAPLGLLLGVPFAGRIRLMHLEPRADKANSPAEKIAWVWAINGSASVVGSILAALLALTFGFTWVLRIGSLCYAGAFIVEALGAAASQSPRR
jgi:hypothetical protein